MLPIKLWYQCGNTSALNLADLCSQRQSETQKQKYMQSLMPVFFVGAIKTVIVKYSHTEQVLLEISC